MKRRGLTLVEVLLVLGLLVIIAAMAWPMLQKPFATQRLNTAVDAVRTEWCGARVEAMRSGHTYAFRYVVGGDRYRKGREDDPAAQTAGPMPGPVDGQTSATPDGVDPSEEEFNTPADDASPEEKTLPEGIHFVADAAAPGDGPPPAPAADYDPPDDADWSEPIFFYPDGTTSDAHVVLANDHNVAVKMVLRGLTGTVTVGDVASNTE